jgi:hypothetical protein
MSMGDFHPYNARRQARFGAAGSADKVDLEARARQHRVAPLRNFMRATISVQFHCEYRQVVLGREIETWQRWARWVDGPAGP